MRIRMLLFSLIAASAAVAACASAPPDIEKEAKQRPDTSRCMDARDLGEWEPLNDRAILFFVSNTGRAHLVVLAKPLQDLKSAGDIEVIDGDLDGFICPGEVDGIYVPDCDCESTTITGMEYLTEKQTSDLLGEPLPGMHDP